MPPFTASPEASGRSHITGGRPLGVVQASAVSQWSKQPRLKPLTIISAGRGWLSQGSRVHRGGST